MLIVVKLNGNRQPYCSLIDGSDSSSRVNNFGEFITAENQSEGNDLNAEDELKMHLLKTSEAAKNQDVRNPPRLLQSSEECSRRAWITPA